MNKDYFFEKGHLLKNNRAGPEPLQEAYHTLLLPIATEKVLRQLAHTPSKI